MVKRDADRRTTPPSVRFGAPGPIRLACLPQARHDNRLVDHVPANAGTGRPAVEEG